MMGRCVLMPNGSTAKVNVFTFIHCDKDNGNCGESVCSGNGFVRCVLLKKKITEHCFDLLYVFFTLSNFHRLRRLQSKLSKSQFLWSLHGIVIATVVQT